MSTTTATTKKTNHEQEEIRTTMNDVRDSGDSFLVLWVPSNISIGLPTKKVGGVPPLPLLRLDCLSKMSLSEKKRSA